MLSRRWDHSRLLCESGGLTVGGGITLALLDGPAFNGNGGGGFGINGGNGAGGGGSSGGVHVFSKGGGAAFGGFVA